MTVVPFNKSLALAPDEIDEPVPGIRRIMANNPSPFTFKGTITYIIGHGKVAIIDPGPDDARHVDALLSAVRNETVTHIFVTHTHNDHSPAVAAIKKATGAAVYAEGPHRPSRPLHAADILRPADREFRPDVTLHDGEIVSGDGWALEALTTPGHTANHLTFALNKKNVLFSGDHVMGWSSTIVAPPDGSMFDYIASLKKLARRGESLYFPGHGPAIKNATEFVPSLIAHRKAREESILVQLASGLTTVSDIVSRSYGRLDERLVPAARMTVLAHLEDMITRGIVTTSGPPWLDSNYRLSTPTSHSLSDASGGRP
jgi:glyoxylase-like metal-dependent hydrolase (beta-lactamase superfamily II)